MREVCRCGPRPSHSPAASEAESAPDSGQENRRLYVQSGRNLDTMSPAAGVHWRRTHLIEPVTFQRLIGRCSLVLLLCHAVCVAVTGVPVLGAEDQTPQTIHRVLAGFSVRLDCYPPTLVDPPTDVFIVQWKKQGSPSPVLLFRRKKSVREGRGYEGRVALLDTASLHIVDVRLSDEGIYDCQVFDVNGRPYVNGTVVALRVDDLVPRFTAQPRDVLVAVNGVAEFSCAVHPSPVVIRWLFDGQPCGAGSPPDALVSDGRIRVTVSADPNVQRLQIGEFACAAEWGSAVIYSKTANLTLAEIGAYREQEPIHISALEGGYAVVPGTVPHSVPSAVVSVTHNGTTLLSSSPRTILMPSGNLHIKDVRASDSGAYQFSALNPVTGERVTAKNVVFLQVIVSNRNHSAQLLAAQKKMNEAVLGSNVSLECAASGNPPPRISWSKYGGLLPEGRYSQILGNLFLYQLRPNDTGTYVCEVENEIDLPVSTIAALDVLEVPEIHRWIDKYEIRETEDLVLECDARGNPKPVVKWLHNGTVLVGTDMVIVKESKVNIRYSQREHSGLYQCLASNAAGTVQATTLVRVIPYLALDGETGAVVSASSQRGHRREHSPLNDRSWGPSSSRNSTLTFIKEDDGIVDGVDDELDQSDDYPIEGGLVDVDDSGGGGGTVNVDDEGDWPIQSAKRNHRKKNKKKSRKKGKNGAEGDGLILIPPTRPEVTKLTDESVMVRWDVPPNSGLAILFFKVQYRDVTKRSRWMTIDEDIPPHVHSYEVLNLRTGRAYRFRIAAVYSNKDNNLGPNSVRFVLLKDPPMKKPDVGPTIVHAEAIAPSAISLRWQHLDMEGVPVDGFFIYYRATTKAGDYTKITVLGSNTLNYIISHLLPETSYDIKMQCFNSAGTSDFSNIHTEKTLVSPDSPPKANKESYPTRLTPISNTGSSDRLLYTIFGSILFVLTVALVSFITYCTWKQRRRQTRRAANASKVIENGRERGMYAVANGAPATGNGHIGNGGGGGMFLWDKVAVVNGSHRQQQDTFPVEETSLVEAPLRIIHNNNNNNEDREDDDDDDDDDEVAAMAEATDDETQDFEDEEDDLDLRETRNQGRQPTTTSAVCQPLIHRQDRLSSEPEDADEIDVAIGRGDACLDIDS